MRTDMIYNIEEMIRYDIMHERKIPELSLTIIRRCSSTGSISLILLYKNKQQERNENQQEKQK